jgi:hypothetical protein
MFLSVYGYRKVEIDRRINWKLSELREAQRRIIVIILGIWKPEGIHTPPIPHPLFGNRRKMALDNEVGPGAREPGRGTMHFFALYLTV